MSSGTKRVRCYNCGRLGPRDVPGCPACGATYGALCTCAAELSVFDDECRACGEPHVPKRVPAARHPWVRAGKWAGLATAAAAAGWVFLAPRPSPIWKLKAEAVEAINESDYETAALRAKGVTEENPADADGWYLLALSYRGLQYGPEVFVPCAENALLRSPGHLKARELLARTEMQRGRIDRAIEHAAAATQATNADGLSWLLLAKLELRKPRPDLARVEAALEKARAAGRDTNEVKVLLAEVSIRMHGAVGGGAERVPVRTAATLRNALGALTGVSPTYSVAMSRARIHLALGEADEAIKDADFALAHLPPESAEDAAIDARLVRAMGLHARGRSTNAEALREFAAVLRERPDSPTAAAVHEYLTAAALAGAAADEARQVLGSAAAANDPKGCLHAVLAAALLERGAVADAARAIETARAASPEDPFFAEIQGSVRAAQRRFDDARAAFRDAIRLAHGLVGPHVRLALVALAEHPPESSPPSTYDAAAAELEALRPTFGDDPFLLEGLGRVHLARGEVAAAREALETAASKWPADPQIWIALAEARRRSAGPRAFDEAAAALANARRLRPLDAGLVLAEADTWNRAGKPDVAVAACTEFLRRRRDHAGVLRVRGDSYAQLGMWSLAATDLRAVVDAGAGTERDLHDLAHRLFRAGDAASAKALVEKARATATPAAARSLEFIAALYGDDPEGAIERLESGGASLLVAEVQLTAGRAEAALETLRRMWKDAGPDPLVARLLVSILLGPEPAGSERLDEARAIAQALPSSAPRAVHDLLAGRISLAEGALEAAVARLRAAVAELPGDPLALLFLGDALFRTGERSESLAALRRAPWMQGALPTLRAPVAQRLLAVSFETKDPSDAEALAVEALRYDPRLVTATFRAVNLAHERGEFAQAAERAERRLQLPGLSVEEAVRLRLAAAIERLYAGDHAASRTHLDAVPPEVRDAPVGLVLRGWAAAAGGRFDDAAALLEAARVASPDEPAAVSGLVLVDLRRGERKSALSRVDAWLAQHPQDRTLTLEAARLFLREGYTDDAARFAGACAARDPADRGAAAILSRALRKAGRGREAVDALRRAADAVPAAEAMPARLAAAAAAAAAGVDLEPTLAFVRPLAEDASLDPSTRLTARAVEAETLQALGRARDAESAARSLLGALASSALPGPPERRLEARARFVLGLAAATAAPPRRAEAVEHFLRCTELERDNLDAANNLAWVLAQDRETSARALDLARRITSEEPGNAAYWSTLAEAASASDEPEEAERAWRRQLTVLAASERPDAAAAGRAGLRFARFLRERGRDPEARRVAEETLASAAGTPSETALRQFLR